MESNKKFQIILFALGLLVGAIVFYLLQPSKPVINTVYKPGKPTYIYSKGKDSIVYKLRYIKVSETLTEDHSKDSSKSIFFKEFSRDDSIKYKGVAAIETYPKCDSTKLILDFDYMAMNTIRRDTVFKLQVDTLVQRIAYPKPPLLEDNRFWIGFGTGVGLLGLAAFAL
jgi:uncharacterized membrane protein